MTSLATPSNQNTSKFQYALWAGRLVSAVAALGLVASATMKLSHQAKLVEGFVGQLGYPESTLTGIGLLELACVALYVIPRTRVLGAVLVTGYLGGAIATHVRIGEAFVAPLVLGVLFWLGLYLRDARVRAISPFQPAS
jgi:hypothetical protein